MGQKLYVIEALILTLQMPPLLLHRFAPGIRLVERCLPTYWTAANPSGDGPLSASLSDARERETLSDGRAY